MPQLTVDQNLFLGNEKGRFGVLDKQQMHRQAREILDRLGFELIPGKRLFT